MAMTDPDELPADSARAVSELGAVDLLDMLAALGGCVAAAWYLLAVLFAGYWPGLLHLVLFLVGYARLALTGPKYRLLIGGCCWFWIWGQLCRTSGTNEFAAFNLWWPAYGVVLTGNACALIRWLWNLPWPRVKVVGVLSSLLMGVILLVKPYWVARHWGQRADLQGASLILADLQSANLKRANLRGADLRGACLWGADLTGADLAGVKLTGAGYDLRTQWPAGFNPEPHGAALQR